MAWVQVPDYRYPGGWQAGADAEARSRFYCEQLEASRIVFFESIPFDLPEADREFLVSQRQSESRLHKNISYRPAADLVRGSLNSDPGEEQRLHAIMRRYSETVTGFLQDFLRPYAAHWSLDYASYRPVEEENRDLPLHKRNDLLHVDAFPSRPTGGGRILRAFTNINPTEARVWSVTEGFRDIAGRFAREAGLERIAESAASPVRALTRPLASMARAVGVPVVNRSPYDEFMLRFHHWLKENTDFQQNYERTRIEFPPYTSWIVYTDAVPHAVLSGRFALEQTYIIRPSGLVTPQEAPVRVLEGLCGRSLSYS